MFKKIITLALFYIALQSYCTAQSTLTKFIKKNNYDLMLTTEPFGSSLGGIMKVSQDFLKKKHIEASLGMAFQYSYTFKTKFENNMSPDTKTVDESILITQDWKYYPFRKKTLQIESGIYGGITRSVAKGNLSLPEYNVQKTYYNRHVYFNYGSMQSLSWNFKERYQLGLFSMISLNGLLDSGRSRLAEVDSRFFVGLKLGYKFK